MKKLLIPVLVAGLLAGCEQAREEEQVTVPGQDKAPLTSGVDIEGMHLGVRPQDDYYEYANGSWLAEAEIPADEIGWGSYLTLHKESLEQSRAIVDDLLKGEDTSRGATQLAGFYKAWMDEERVESLGISPLADDLAEIAALASHEEVGAYMGALNPGGVDGPINFYVWLDPKDSTRYAVSLFQSGLGLPDRDYYFDESERGQVLMGAYREYLQKLLTLAGFEDPAASVARVIDIETRLAEHQWDKVKNRDRDLTYNPYTHDEFSALLANLNIDAYLEGIAVGEQSKYVVQQPSYFEALNTLFRETDIATWQDYLSVRLLMAYARYLSDDFVQARFSFQQAVYGLEEMTPRWRRAISSINSEVGELLGQYYVARHFSPESKQKMEVMVDYLIRAYEDSIKNLDWMGEGTREKALEKLSKFTPKIGYPDKWKDFSSLEVAADDLVGNIRRAKTFNHMRDVNKLGKPIDRTEWLLPPQTVNAYYTSALNEIVFPAAYLQPPMFRPDAEDAYNYGSIGSTIGHEIGHGFDDQGSKSDGDGNLVSWWTDEDRSKFEELTKGLVAQFNAYQVAPGLNVNGELTLGENIGDLGGTAIALKAYRMSLEGRDAPVIDGFTAEERFFLGNAQSARIKWREQFLEYLVKNDPHSPDRFRVNGVLPNIDAFYETYDVKEGDALYIAPADRIAIWQ